VIALRHAKLYADKVKAVKEPAKLPVQCATYNTAVSFTDEDLLLGSKPHNRPLFVTGYIRGQKVKRILVDGGSAINIMPKSTMNDLGITIDEFSKSRMMIQGFNLEGQRAIGMICLKLTIGNLSTTSFFHVIDSKTSYKLLLERPWLHEHGVVASTLHQCLKYYRDEEKKVNGDTKPFTRVESYFADARFFDDDAPLKEAMPATIFSTGKRSEEDVPGMIHGGPSGNVKQSRPSEKETSKLLSPLVKQQLLQQDLRCQYSGISPNPIVRTVKHPLVNAQLLRV